MFRILTRRELNPTVTMIEVEAPRIAEKALAGQFVILRTDGRGERIPLTIAGTDKKRGAVAVIFQVVGGTTMALNEKRAGDTLADFVGPLGNPTEIAGVKKAIVVGGGVGCAIALPVARRLKEAGAAVHSVIGFRSSEFVILSEEFRAFSDSFALTTDDGSLGEKGNVCIPLRRLLEGETFDAVYAIGPLVMMKFVAAATEPYHVKTIVSMDPIMIDGTGMCGCCRVRVGGEMKFACVDGPDFDAHLIDFDEAIARNRAYLPFEAQARERHCNLYKKEVN